MFTPTNRPKVWSSFSIDTESYVWLWGCDCGEVNLLGQTWVQAHLEARAHFVEEAKTEFARVWRGSAEGCAGPITILDDGPKVVPILEAELVPEWQGILIDWLERPADDLRPLDFDENPIPQRLQTMLAYLFGGEFR